MPIIDMTNWSFELGGASRLDKAMGNDFPPRILSYASAFELLRYVSDENIDDYIAIQSKIDDRLVSAPAVQQLKELRTPLKCLKHFPRYRLKKSKLYHSAANAEFSGKATKDQLALARGLEAEIYASRVILSLDQIVFHGRAGRLSQEPSRYNSFLSTSLNPIVAKMSAIRIAGKDHERGRQTVYLLTLGSPLRALWGQVGNSVEWELLLSRGLLVKETQEHRGMNFDVVAASIHERDLPYQ